MKKISLSDCVITVEDKGSGLPVLLIHGFPLTRRMWQPQVKGLSKAHRVLVPDLRGHGDSTSGFSTGMDEMTFTMDQLAEDCVQLLDSLHITQPIILCGLSMGGYVCFAFYRIYPQRVSAIILAATRAGADSPEAVNNRRRMIDTIRTSGSEAVTESLLPKLLSPVTMEVVPELVSDLHEIMRGVPATSMIADLKGMIARPDSRPLLPEIRIPALVLAGADDQIIPAAEAELMAAAIPQASSVTLPRAGHLLNLEQPSLFNNAVSQFIESIK